MVQDVLYAVAVIGGLGLVFGAGLGYAGKRFAVEEDAVTALIRGLLPGANCGGCGYLGCDELAKAISAGEAKYDACPVGGPETAKKIAEALGKEAGEFKRLAAFVKCAGDNDKAQNRYTYEGLNDCRSAALLSGGGAKSCKYGCLGMGSCDSVCAFGAIRFINGVAVVDGDKCTACGQCAKICPRHIIELVPAVNPVRVACSSHDNARTVMACCSVGCRACKLCEKACNFNAIKVEEMLAEIDYEKCRVCGECAGKCPAKIITKQ
ncbi:MAG: RnfABCDGE type electron transport complex subunit B [Clostridiales bacterium]|nr:RnfABCDGE type electron transport complex subunit B [Clostridiales bacterium]